MGGPAPLPLINFPSFLPASATAGGREMIAVANAVNPTSSTINCGFNIDAASARLNGTNPNATAPPGQDGSWSQIEGRFNTTPLNWHSSFNDAYDAVRNGGPGTQAIVGIQYAGGGAHVVVLANNQGTVGIVEAQDWGAGNPREVITDPARAVDRYGASSNIGWGIVGSNP